MDVSPELLKTGQELIASLSAVYGEQALRAAVMNLPDVPKWPVEYENRTNGRVYKPHNEAETEALKDVPFCCLVSGGWGGGKSTFGVVKTLRRVARGMSGIMASNDLPQFRKSLWVEFQKWCPWDLVVEHQQYRGEQSWRPLETFTMNFTNGAFLECGGMDNPPAWYGPNINFAYVDEVARKTDASVLQVCTSRVRIPGPKGEPPQIWFTTTPAMNWLYDYFGPLKCQCNGCGQEVEIAIQEGDPLVCPNCQSVELRIEDNWADFKHKSKVIRIRTAENVAAGNITEDYIENCKLSLTSAEAEVMLDALWRDVQTGQPFLPSMLWWDECKGEVPALNKDTPLVIAVDAASGRDIGDSDCFGIMAISRHPEETKRKTHAMVRYCKTWQARPGQRIDPLGTEDHPGPERDLLRLCGWKIEGDGRMIKVGSGYNVKCIVADPNQLNDMIQRFRRNRVVWVREFGQVSERIVADNDLLHVIQEHRVVHDGNQELRRHIANADRKLDPESKKLRIVKRMDSLKIDLSVCLSMGCHEVLRLNL